MKVRRLDPAEYWPDAKTVADNRKWVLWMLPFLVGGIALLFVSPVLGGPCLVIGIWCLRHVDDRHLAVCNECLNDAFIGHDPDCAYRNEEWPVEQEA